MCLSLLNELHFYVYVGKIHNRFSHWGCKSLLKRVNELQIPLHLFGHVHDDVGIEKRGFTVFSNAAMDIEKTPSVLEITAPRERYREGWPTHKLSCDSGKSPEESSKFTALSTIFRRSVAVTKPRAVLLTTGAMNPVHNGHLHMMEQSKAYIESELGYNVIGGYLSPSSDIYVKPKMMRNLKGDVPLEAVYAPASHRIRLTQKAVESSSWLSCSTWEADQPRFRDFDDVQRALDTYLHEHNIFLTENDKVFYVCGSDHFVKCGLQHGIHCSDGRTRPVVAVGRADDDKKSLRSASEHAFVVPPSTAPGYVKSTSQVGFDDLSSTKIRYLFNNIPRSILSQPHTQEEDEFYALKEQLKELLPSAVYDDIVSAGGEGHALYRLNS